MNNEFQECVKKLVGINRKHRKSLFFNRNVEKTLSPLQIAMEFGTVRVDIGRRTGKTEYIKRNAKDNDVVIVGNQQMVNLYLGMKTPIVSASNIERWAKECNPVSDVYIDEPELVFKVIPQNIIYKCLYRNVNQTFILLGR